MQFRDITDEAGIQDRQGITTGVNLTDVNANLNGDGDLDLVTNNLHEPAILYENLASERLKNNYIHVRLIIQN